MDVKYNKHSQRLKAYVQDGFNTAQLHSNSILTLRSVKGFTVPAERESLISGACHKSARGLYDITIYMGVTGKDKYIPFEMILTALAHELAHLVHWDHEAPHWKLMCTIMGNWSNMLEYHVEDTNECHTQR